MSSLGDPTPQEVPGLSHLNGEDSRGVIRNCFAFCTVSKQITSGEIFYRPWVTSLSSEDWEIQDQETSSCGLSRALSALKKGKGLQD